MVTTIEVAEVPNFVQGWMMQAAGIAPDEPEPAPEPVPELDADEPEYVPVVDRRADWAGPRAAILATTGLDIAEPPVIEARPDFIAPSPPQTPQGPAQPPETSTEPAADPTKDYVRRERGWRERNNLPRVKRHLSPCDTSKGRRERYARKRAAELGISYDEALAGIRQRPADDALRAPQGGPGGRAVRKYLTSPSQAPRHRQYGSPR